MSDKPLKKAISLIFREGEQVRVFKRSMSKETYPGVWSLPSTYLAETETATEAANRLVRRKLGLESVELESLPIGESQIVDKQTYLLQMTDYKVLGYEGSIVIDPQEYTEELPVLPSELLVLINRENAGIMGECTKTFLQSEGVI